MNLFEQWSREVQEINTKLTMVAKSTTYRIARGLRIFFTELKSKSLKRIGGFVVNLFKRAGGNRSAMAKYGEGDLLEQTIAQTKALEKQIEEKKNMFDELSEREEPAVDIVNQVSMDDVNILEYTNDFHGEIRMPKGKRVAYFTNLLLDWNDRRPRFGGGERYCLTLSRLLKKQGFEVQIYQTAPTEFSGEYYGFPVQTIVAGEYYSEFNIDAANKFYEISKEYDYVIYNLPELSAMKMRSDAIIICHGIWFDHNNYGEFIKFRKHKWFQYLHNAFSSPKHIVSVDTNSVNVIRVLWPELVNKMTFIPNFVDHNMFYPPKKRENEKLVVLFPRRSQINRGSRLLKDILQMVPYDVEFFWVGEGDDYDTQLILNLTKEDKRLHYEKATFDEMPAWYQKADITVIPTIACEGTSLSCIESMASGCATIATNVGGLTDIIYDEVNGLSVNPTAEDIADAINRVIADADLRKKLQDSGLEYSYHFSIEKWERKWLKVFNKIGWIEDSKKKKMVYIN